MERIIKKVLKHRKLTIIFFIAAALICVIAQTSVKVNYNMSDYLPADVLSTKALDVMYEEFGGAVADTRIMIPDISIAEALEYKQKLNKIDGVSNVLWLDDIADIKEPLETLNQSIVTQYYKNGAALYSVSVEKGCESEVVAELRSVIGENGAVSGESVVSATSQDMAVSEVLKAVVFLVPIIVIILLITTEAYIEPVLFLMTIGTAVLINMGTNLIFGEVSFMTQSISPILQMAVSLDYAIFLLHSFGEFRQTAPDDETAMAMAVKRSFSVVLASAVTTLLGFLALVIMRFKIGSDLGINLAKGIIISFISVIVLLPALTLSFKKLLDKTAHKKFAPRLTGLSKIISKLRIPAVILIIILIIPCFLAQQKQDFSYGMGELDVNDRAGRDEALINKAFGRSTPIVLLVPRGEPGKEALMADELSKIPSVVSVVSYATSVGIQIPTEYLSTAITEQFYSQNYCRIILYADTGTEGDIAFKAVESVMLTAKKYYGDKALACGSSVSLYDMRDVITADSMKVTLTAIIGIALTLLITFKSLSLPIILVLTIEASIWINLAISYFSGTVLCYIGYLVIGTVQLGATVDYAILLSDHYMANRQKHPPKKAAAAAIREAFLSVVTSAVILSSAGFVIMWVSGNEVVSQLGELLGRGTLISAALVLVFLPAALSLFDKAVQVTTFKAKELI